VSGPRRQQGAAAVFAAIALTALLAALALVVDIGSLYFAKRDLQNAASLAALDAVRVGSGCYGPAPEDEAEAVNTAARAALQRNDQPVSWLSEPPRLGSMITIGSGERVFVAGDIGLGFAAEVTLERPMPRRLLPDLFRSGSDDNGEVQRMRASATAQAQNNVSLEVGSYGARVSPTAPGALLAALPVGVSITALDYSALVDAEVSLGDLQPGSVSDLTEFLSEQTTLPAFLDALAAALLAANDSVAAAAVAALSAASSTAQTLIPGDLINIDSTITPLLTGATFSAGSLVEAALQSVLIDGVFETLIQLGGGREVAVALREVAQPAFGPPGQTPEGDERTSAGTAQVRVSSGLDLSDLLPTGTELTLFVESAGARATVTGVRCPRAGQPRSEARVRTETSVARVGIEPVSVNLSLAELQSGLGQSNAQLGNLLGGISNLSCTLLGGLGSLGSNLCQLLTENPLLELRITLPPVELVDSANDERWVPGPFPAEPHSVGSDLSNTLSSGVESLLSDQLQIELSLAGGEALGGGLNAVLGNLLAVLRPLLQSALVDALSDELINGLEPVLADLGVSLAGADVTVVDMQIERPRIVTTRRGG
jgi:uncharacterized membrane protein